MQITPANDEPGSPRARPGYRRAKLMRLVENLEHGADGRVGIGAILREIEAIAPGAIDREAARLQALRLGLRPLGELDLSVLDYPEA